MEWGLNCTVLLPSNIYKCKIGNNVRIGPFVEIQSDCVVGDNSVVSSHCFLASGTRVGSHVFIGHGVMTCNDKYPVANNRDWLYEPPTIQDHASVGTGAIILPGVTIGEHAKIAAGAVITKNVPANTTAIGVW